MLVLTSVGAAAQSPSGTAEQGAQAQASASEDRRLVITHVLSSGEVIPVPGGLATLPRGYRNLEVRYVLAGRAPAGPFRYRFRLDGVEDEWAEVGERTAAYYRNLGPGTFTLRVQALSAEGGWEHEATLGVRVEPHPWETLAFRIALLLVLLGLGLGVLHLRTRSLALRARTLAGLVEERTAALKAEKERAEAALLAAQRDREAARAASAEARAHAEDLRRADDLRRQFFANLSHEVRTPLTLLLGTLEEAERGGLGPAPGELREGLAHAAANGRRLQRLVDEMLDLARIEADHLELRLRPLGLVPLVQGAVAAFAPLAERAGVALYLDAPPGPLPVLADGGRLEQILFNLLANAFKVTPAGGKVLVGMEVHDVQEGFGGDGAASVGAAEAAVLAEIRVQDTGPGIGPDVLPCIFDRFFHADAPGCSGGTGLGLALSRELARKHGGDLEATSVPGFGSTLTLRLHLHGASEEDLAEEPLAAEPLAEEPLAEEPLAEEPLAEEPLAEEPLAEEPSGQRAPAHAALARGTALAGGSAAEAEPSGDRSGAAERDGEPSGEGAAVPAEASAEGDGRAASEPAKAKRSTEPSTGQPTPTGLALTQHVEDEAARLPSGNGAGSAPDDDAPTALPLVLVAEDNPEIAALLRRHLRDSFRVVSAGDGAEALRLAHLHRPDLILSDLVMPGVDGLAFLDAVRTDPDLADLPFVLLSARAMPEDRLEGLRHGADDYIAKPYHAAVLLARLDRLIQSRRALRARYGARVIAGGASAPVDSADARLLERIHEAITAHLDDEGFSVAQLAEESGVSQAQLKRKVRHLAGTTPVELIRSRRLDRAAELIAARAGTVGEAAAAVGFSSPSYFARCFRTRFGVAPSEYGRAHEG